MNAKPFLLSPAGKDYLWGGERLKTEYGYDLPLTPFAEAWVCSAHPDGPSRVISGEHKGKDLLEVLKKHPAYLGAHAAGLADGALPVLVKLIDAKSDLSVQVHPNDDYARVHENQSGKTELWYILDAKPDASLIYGFSHEVTPQQVSEAVRQGTVTNYLQRVPVHTGDVFYLPPGTVHAIGGGILLAEIQQSSNVTYRIFDYNRRGKDGQLRPLHLSQALAVADFVKALQFHQQMRILRCRAGGAEERISHCTYFCVDRILPSPRMRRLVGQDSFTCALCIGGEGMLSAAGEKLTLKKGGCAFVPAGAGETVLSGNMEILWISC